MIQTICAAFFLTWILFPAESFAAQARGAQPAPRAQRAPARPQPMTLKQVIESLSSLRNTARVEALVNTRGVQFQATPAIVDILKEFGAGPKLLAMIPVPPPPPPPPAPKIAGSLTVICEPTDCSVIVNDMYKGTTAGNRQVIDGLQPGEAALKVFADGYDSLSRQVQLQEGAPLEERFVFKRSEAVRRQAAGVALLNAVAELGGIDGFGHMGDFEGDGVVHWADTDGDVQEWTMTFTKRAGRDLAMTFRTREGQCTASILAQTAKQDCRSGLRNGGEGIAEQAASLFLSYQPQDVLQTLMERPLLAGETDDKRLESANGADTYTLTIGSDGLPADLVYQIGEGNAPIHVQYSNYINLNTGRYPSKIAIGRLNSPAVWTFTVNTLRSRLTQRSR